MGGGLSPIIVLNSIWGAATRDVESRFLFLVYCYLLLITLLSCEGLYYDKFRCRINCLFYRAIGRFVLPICGLFQTIYR